MEIAKILLMIALFVVSILLVVAVLIQNAKGGGIASNVGISNQLFGARRETELIEKWTWRLMGILAVMCILSGFLYEKRAEGPSNTYTPISERVDFLPSAN